VTPRQEEMLSSSIRLAIFEIQKRSLNTYAGWTWSLMNPLAQMGIIYFIMVKVFKSPVENVELWLISGLTSWIIIQAALLRSCESLTSRRALMLNNNISPTLLVSADVLSEAFVLAPFYFLGIVIAIVHHVPISNLLFIPVLFLIIVVFLHGAGLILATLTPYLRDLPYLMGIGLQITFWLTPIAYARAALTGYASVLVNVNPFTYFILLSQDIFMGKPLSILSFLVPASIAIVAIVVGLYLSRTLGKNMVMSL
jgi:lipopolysaccharide transport system permease protein